MEIQRDTFRTVSSIGKISGRGLMGSGVVSASSGISQVFIISAVSQVSMVFCDSLFFSSHLFCDSFLLFFCSGVRSFGTPVSFPVFFLLYGSSFLTSGLVHDDHHALTNIQSQ